MSSMVFYGGYIQNSSHQHPKCTNKKKMTWIYDNIVGWSASFASSACVLFAETTTNIINKKIGVHLHSENGLGKRISISKTQKMKQYATIGLSFK